MRHAIAKVGVAGSNPVVRSEEPQVIYEGRAVVKGALGHHLLTGRERRTGAGVKVERPTDERP
jgi:hypothetical protein